MSETQAVARRNETFKQSLKRFAEPRMAMMLVLGFTAGLPFLLYFSTLSVWLEKEAVDVAVIGFFSWFGLSYSLKMFWAPLLDRFEPPGFAKIFGKRRAWIFVAQLCIAMALIGIGISDPTKNLMATALFSGLLAFSSATQDIGIDAWRIEAAHSDDEQAPLAAAYQYGYKVGMIISGGVALFMAGIANFNLAYISMAAIMATASIVFAVWDRKFGVQAAAAAGAVLMLVGLFTAFNGLGGLFADGSATAFIFIGFERVFQVIAAIATAGFVYFIARALMDRPEGQSFSLASLLSGFVFSALVFLGIAFVGGAIGWLVPQVFEVFGIAPTRGQIARWAVYVAVAPLLLCTVLIPVIRKLPEKSRHLKHPAYGAFTDFFWRHGWPALLILCFVSAYRLSDIVMGIMAKPAYSAMGYTPEQIGLASGIYGVWIVFIGVAAAGLSALRLGLKVSLVIGAIVSVLGNLTFSWMVTQSSDTLWPIILAITADNIAGGYAGTIFIAYMSTLVNKSFAGTQYAIFSSVWSLGPKLVAGTSGVLVAKFGYPNFFLIAAVLGVPAILLSFFTHLMKPDRGEDEDAAPADESASAV